MIVAVAFSSAATNDFIATMVAIARGGHHGIVQLARWVLSKVATEAEISWFVCSQPLQVEGAYINYIDTHWV